MFSFKHIFMHMCVYVWSELLKAEKYLIHYREKVNETSALPNETLLVYVRQ